MIFADTFYFIALLSPVDQAHRKAVEFTRRFTDKLLTTAWVLTEVADGLVEERAKSRFLDFYDQLQTRTDVAIIACADDLFRDGLELYRRRLDKEWSLTDCISFVVMQQQGLTDALTADHHFEQAGFTALLK